VVANGWDPTKVTVQKAAGARPSQFRVTMSSTVNNPFGAVLGVPTTTITRTAVADYASPVPMGSPCNLFGSEPPAWGGTGQGPEASSDCAGTGSYWMNIAGKNTNKARGDGYASGYCTKPDAGSIDNCAPAEYTNPGAGQTPNNTDYPTVGEQGYTFIVRTKAAGTLQLEGYDIGWVATGDQCTDNYPILNGARPTNNFVTTAAEANERYKKAGGSHCTGDSSMSGREGDESTVKTIVTVRQPSPDPGNPLAGAEICTLTLPGWDRNTPLSALTGPGGGASDQLLKRTFHRWANLTEAEAGFTSGPGCSPNLAVGANQDYSVQIRTEGGGGQNRFALRAKLSGSNANVSIFAASRVSLFNNVNAGTSHFKALRLNSSSAGRTLVVRLFDLGDATAPVDARILQPDSATVGGVPLDSNAPFANCVGAGPKNGPLTNCSVVTTASTNGGKWQEIAIKIPIDYACTADSDQSKCWVRIRLNTTSGQNDTTTWSARLDGDPVRLVE